MPELVATRARLHPDTIAVTDGVRTLTFGELNARATALANVLRASGVGSDVVVGLLFPRSPAMTVGALGILKAGGAYLPLDPSHPPARRTFILNDACVALIVGAPGEKHHIPVIALDEAGCLLHSRPSLAGENEKISPQNLAYVIYTSGSTGQPNGVEITHESFSNLVRWHCDTFQVTPSDRASHLANVAFDAAVWEIWPCLAAGASLHLPKEETARDPHSLRSWLVTNKITLCFVPTPLAEHLLALPWPSDVSLRTMLTGADTLHTYPPPGLPFSLVNNYGPTECTVVATSGMVSSQSISNRLPPIGSSIANTQVFILDESGDQVPPGASGELHVGGLGLARGYRNRPELTAKRFIANRHGSRLFKTGDRAKFLPDGQIAFLGRIDEQVKVRGFRVEPNEIAAILNQHPGVQQSVVIARELTPEDAQLIAYFVATPDFEPTLRDLRDFLTIRLPEYMVPPTLVRLDKLLLTPNGKIDRKSLPEPTEENILKERAPTAPRTEMERIITEILQHLLKLDCVDVEENFFSLGGHSLLGAQLVARLRDRFCIEIPLRLVFDAPTVADLSAEIERLRLARPEASETTFSALPAPLGAVS